MFYKYYIDFLKASFIFSRGGGGAASPTPPPPPLDHTLGRTVDAIECISSCEEKP